MNNFYIPRRSKEEINRLNKFLQSEKYTIFINILDRDIELSNEIDYYFKLPFNIYNKIKIGDIIEIGDIVNGIRGEGTIEFINGFYFAKLHGPTIRLIEKEN